MLARIPRQSVLVGIGYLVVAMALIAPVMGSLSTHFVGGDTSDVYEMAHHIWWFKTALAQGGDVFYHSLLAYPDGMKALQLWANPLQFFPMWLFAIFMPLALAYNIGILLTLTLNGLTMYLLARQRFSRGQQVPALFAGLIYMVFPLMQGHLFEGHPGLLAQWPVPLLLLFLYEYVNVGGLRRLALAVLFFLLSAMGQSLQALYLLAPLCALFLIVRLLRRDYVGATRLVLVALIGGALLLLYLSPIFAESTAAARHTAAGGYVRYSVDLLGLISPSFANPFWHDIAPHSQRVLGTNLGEGASYVGVIGLLLAVLGLAYRRETRWWLLLACVSWLLALGPVLKVFDQPLSISVAGYNTVIPLPYALLMELPLIELARTPGRFMFLFAAAFAIMAGHGMAALWSSALFRRRNRFLRYGMAIALAAALFLDYQLFERFPMQPAEIPDAIAQLGEGDEFRAVFNVPHDNLLAAKEAMYLQTAHGLPLIAGHDTRVTPVDPGRLTLLSAFPPQLLRAEGADIVILNKARARQDSRLYWTARAQLGSPRYEDGRFAVFEVSPSRSAEEPQDLYSTIMGEQEHLTYIYRDGPGWLRFRARLAAENRRVSLSMNDLPLQGVTVVGAQQLSLPLPFARRGYYTFRIALDPPCPERIDTRVLLCHVVTMEDVELELLSDSADYNPIRIADGIELAAYHMPDNFAEDPVIHFWWSFNAPRSANDVRFVHVLDENRGRADQDDTSFGVVPAGSDRYESVELDNVRDLAPGRYLVLTGWYSLPDVVRYDVLTNVEGAQDNTIVLGTIDIGE